MGIAETIFSFFVYAFLGYLCEVIYCSIGQKKLVNRGYLYAPICPIYGFGAVFIILSMWSLRQHWYLVFMVGIILTSTLEYLTSFLLETFFHMRWWDYSKRKFNLKGRICLRNSILFGGLVIAVIYGLQPLFIQLIENMTTQILWILNGILLGFLMVDFTLSTIKNINIAKVIKKLNELKNNAADKWLELKDNAEDKLLELKEGASLKVLEKKEEMLAKLNSFIEKYPNMKIRLYGKHHESVEELLAEYGKKGDENEHH